MADDHNADHDRAAVVAVHTFWARIEARDWAGVRRLLADAATLTWHASNERFLDADAIVRVNAIYPEGWQVRVVDVAARYDGRVHSIVEVRHGDARHFANSLFRFDGARVTQIDEYWSSVDAPPPWRNARAIGAYERFVPPPDLSPAPKGLP